MPVGKQIIKKGICHIGGKKKRSLKGGAFPIGLLASVAGPILGTVAQPILEKIIVGRRPKRRSKVKRIIIRI